MGGCGGTGLIPYPLRWVKESGVATVAAWIQSLAWELPYTMDTAIKNLERNEKENSARWLVKEKGACVCVAGGVQEELRRFRSNF